jgi:UDP-N-acetylmuramoyl-L-alanyl-D-glutamate--2,6-diaminopimelate ligase
MGVKHFLTTKIRRSLSPDTVKKIEDVYRSSRSKVISTVYGNPAKNLKVIAVTGTNGKTTTANYLNEILKQAGYKTAMFSTAIIEINNHKKINDLNVTVATTSQMHSFFKAAKKNKVDYVILEATSHALDQHKLDNVPIEAAIMTNLTQDHLDYHKTMEKYAEAKAKLFKLKPKYIVLNRDDSWFEYFDQFPAESQKITYGTSPNSEARINHVKLYKKGSEAQIIIDNNVKLDLSTNLPGQFNIYNMTAAASLAYLLGLKLDDIVEGIANLDGVPGRFERVTEGLSYDVIVDYAHTPDGLEKILEAARPITKNRIILVFGACGDRDKVKRPIMGEIAARLADRIILTDEESYNEDPQSIRDMIREGIVHGGGEIKMNEIADRHDAIKKALSIAMTGDMVLITGMGHEKFRIVNGSRMPWNDADVVREILNEKYEQ